MTADPCTQIRTRLQTAIRLCERYANRSGPFRDEMLDVLAMLGMAEHEIEMARVAAQHALRQP